MSRNIRRKFSRQKSFYINSIEILLTFIFCFREPPALGRTYLVSPELPVGTKSQEQTVATLMLTSAASSSI